MSMPDPFVSICIPVYNGQQYLNECLDSVMRQSFTDYEVIITDDCSKDNSPEIIESYARSSGKIKFYRNEKNLGLVSNWNRCMELAKGKWIKFVFQDDIINSDCIEKMLEHASDDRPFIACSRQFLFGEDVDTGLKKYFQARILDLTRLYDKKTFFYIAPVEVSRNAVKKIAVNFIGEPTCILFSRKLISEIGYFDGSLLQVCDLEYWLRIATVYGISFIPEKLVHFRIHGKSATASNTGTKNIKSYFCDPLILADKLLHHPLFAGFRGALTSIQKIRLREYIKLRIYEADLFINKSKSHLLKTGDINELKNCAAFSRHLKPDWKTKIIHSLVLLKRKFN